MSHQLASPDKFEGHVHRFAISNLCYQQQVLSGTRAISNARYKLCQDSLWTHGGAELRNVLTSFSGVGEKNGWGRGASSTTAPAHVCSTSENHTVAQN